MTTPVNPNVTMPSMPQISPAVAANLKALTTALIASLTWIKGVAAAQAQSILQDYTAALVELSVLAANGNASANLTIEEIKADMILRASRVGITVEEQMKADVALVINTFTTTAMNLLVKVA